MGAHVVFGHQCRGEALGRDPFSTAGGVRRFLFNNNVAGVLCQEVGPMSSEKVGNLQGPAVLLSG